MTRLTHSSPLATLALVAAVVFLGVASNAGAAGEDGGGGPGPNTAPPAAKPGKNGGAAPGKKKRSRRATRRPVIAGFALSNATLTDSSQMKLRYRITGPMRRVRVRGVVRTRGGKFVKTLELGLHRTNVLVTTALTAGEAGVTRAGAYKLRLTARDGRSRAAKRGRRVPAWRGFSFTDHLFPLAGPFSFGGDGARFGTGRPGHTHQGQDLPADSGTAVVAPYAGEISWVAYQAGGAGYYVVEHSDDGRDYVFMHLQKGSTAVRQGQRVAAGDRIGSVGATGVASGPHLHFEVWTGGPWQFGGKPIDPLPLLRTWYSSGRGKAIRTSAVASTTPLD